MVVRSAGQLTGRYPAKVTVGYAKYARRASCSPSFCSSAANAANVALISGESLLSVLLGPSLVPCTPMISAAGQPAEAAAGVSVAGPAGAAVVLSVSPAAMSGTRNIARWVRYPDPTARPPRSAPITAMPLLWAIGAGRR